MKAAADKTEPVRIDKKVLKRARRYVDGTPMTLSGWISSEIKNALDKVAPISKKSEKSSLK